MQQQIHAIKVDLEDQHYVRVFDFMSRSIRISADCRNNVGRVRAMRAWRNRNCSALADRNGATGIELAGKINRRTIGTPIYHRSQNQGDLTRVRDGEAIAERRTRIITDSRRCLGERPTVIVPEVACNFLRNRQVAIAANGQLAGSWVRGHTLRIRTGIIRITRTDILSGCSSSV